jgi:quinol monooxygenase YgiN
VAVEYKAIRLILKIRIKPGQLETFKRLAEGLSADTEASEPHTFSYEWFLTADEKECWITELYADSHAVLLHAGNVIDRFRMIAEANEIVDFAVLGPATPELRAGVSSLGAKVLDRFTGFCR